MAKKPSIKGTTIQKKAPKQTPITDRRDRTLQYQTVDDLIAEIREEYYKNKNKKKPVAEKSQKSKRKEKLAITGEVSYEEQRRRRQTTGEMSPQQAQKALAELLKKRLK